MPCSASSIVTPARKKVPHETPHPRSCTSADQSADGQVPDGLFLVRVERAQYRWDAQKPFYLLRLSVLEPKELAGHLIAGRLYCTPKALWKLNWFLRDFGYDTELLGRDEIDDKSLVGLRGVVKISHVVLNGTSLLNLDGFAPASQWEELATVPPQILMARRSGNDLQLHPDQPIPYLSPPLSSSLSRWLAGERHPGRHALRPRL